MCNTHDAREFESYVDRILEKGLLSAFIETSDYDIQLSLQKHGRQKWKLCVDIAGERISVTPENRERIGDTVYDYLKLRGAFVDVGIDHEMVDWVAVSVNGSETAA